MVEHTIIVTLNQEQAKIMWLTLHMLILVLNPHVKKKDPVINSDFEGQIGGQICFCDGITCFVVTVDSPNLCKVLNQFV